MGVRVQSTPTIGGARTKHAYHWGALTKHACSWWRAYKARLPSGGALTKHACSWWRAYKARLQLGGSWGARGQSTPTVAGLVELPKVFFNLHEDCATTDRTI